MLLTSIKSAGALLEIDLGAVRANYRTLSKQLNGKPCAAVVKADAYGLGVEPIAKALWEEGARTFFVALIDEAVQLRQILPDADIHVLCGNLPDTEHIFCDQRLTPVLNSLEQVQRWANRGPCNLHIDTGMNRLGIDYQQLDAIPSGLDIDILMSHFVAADEVGHPLNSLQIDRFSHAVSKIEHKRASLSNSAGIYLGDHAHFDLGRPGCALYGINPTPHLESPVLNPVTLKGRIVQVLKIDTPSSVGYGATYNLQAGQKLATIAVGYADGYLRYLSSKGVVYVGDQKAPVVGRVSMDLISIDVTNIDCKEGDLVDVIGKHNTPDLLADLAGTIGYEILTSLSRRYHRVYRGT